jgi:cellobiose transport system permease protein
VVLPIARPGMAVLGMLTFTSVIMAGTLIGTLPVVVVFALLGRQIVGGIIAGAVKG